MRETSVKMCAFFAVLCAVLVIGAPVWAEAPVDEVASVTLGVTQVQWTPNAEYGGLRLTVSGPQGTEQWSFGPGESPIFDLAALSAGVDGLYTWELRATPQVDVETHKALASLRAQGTDDGLGRVRPAGLPDESSLVQNGSFRVVDGGILQDAAEEPSSGLSVDLHGGANVATAPLQRATAADQVIANDLIVQGSICVGFDCVNNENFGADTLRLKENNLRIHFDDTSNSGSFPNNDWRLVANDTSNGGRNIFYLEDSTAGRQVVSVEAGARSNALYVEADGDVGLGTANPVVELHIVRGDTPTVRLDQDGSSGFTPQVWDLAGNETNFFVRDVNHSSNLPFRVFPGSGNDDALVITGTGDIGMGTASPDTNLTVKSDGEATNVIKVEDNDSTNSIFRVRQNSGGSSLVSVFDDASTEVIRFTGQAGGRVSIGCSSGLIADLELNANGGACNTGTYSQANAGDTQFTVSSSRTFKEHLQPIPADGILKKISDIDVYHYDFINGPHDRVGLMAEDFHEVFQRGSDKMLSGHEIQMALWLAVKELTSQNEALTQRLAEVEQTLDSTQADD